MKFSRIALFGIVVFLVCGSLVLAYDSDDHKHYRSSRSAMDAREEVFNRNMNAYRNYNPPRHSRVYYEMYYNKHYVSSKPFTYTPSGDKYFKSKRQYVLYRCRTDSRYGYYHYC